MDDMRRDGSFFPNMLLSNCRKGRLRLRQNQLNSTIGRAMAPASASETVGAWKSQKHKNCEHCRVQSPRSIDQMYVIRLSSDLQEHKYLEVHFVAFATYGYEFKTHHSFSSAILSRSSVAAAILAFEKVVFSCSSCVFCWRMIFLNAKMMPVPIAAFLHPKKHVKRSLTTPPWPSHQ